MLAEAHDSGLSADDMMTFSGDPLNLTVAMPHENGTVKGDRDAADCLPANNQCWFAGRVIAVKQRWSLSVDEREAQFLKTALAGCTPEQIVRPVCEASASATTTGNSAEAWLARYDANGNGQVTCAEARAEACGAPIPVTSVTTEITVQAAQAVPERLLITGPEDFLENREIEVGQTVQMQADLDMSDESLRENVVAAWTSSNTTVATVESSGLVTARQAGGFDIRAAAEGLTARLTGVSAVSPNRITDRDRVLRPVRGRGRQGSTSTGERLRSG